MASTLTRDEVVRVAELARLSLSDAEVTLFTAQLADILQYAEAVREQLRAVVLGGARRILVDLAGISEIDSRGLGALVSLVRLAQERGGAVRFFGASPDVYALFELTRLHRVLDFYPNQALAMSQPWRTLETEHGQTA